MNNSRIIGNNINLELKKQSIGMSDFARIFHEIVQSFSILSNQAVTFIRFCILKPDFFVIFHNPMSWFSRSRYDFITFFSSSCSGFSIYGSSASSSEAASLAFCRISASRKISAIWNSISPLWRVPSRSPLPRSFKSSEAI